MLYSKFSSKRGEGVAGSPPSPLNPPLLTVILRVFINKYIPWPNCDIEEAAVVFKMTTGDESNTQNISTSGIL